MRAAAWTAPAVTVACAVPAFAAASDTTPPCAEGTYEIKWERDYRRSTRSATALMTGALGESLGNDPLTLTVSSRFYGSADAATAGDGASNLALSPGNVGGTGTRGLTIMQDFRHDTIPTPRSGSCQVVTFTFSRPVRDLRFTLTDIDSQDPPPTWWRDRPGQYQDRVFLSGSPAGVKGSRVAGSGTSDDPWRSTGTHSQEDPVTGSRGNVQVSYAGEPAMQSFSLTYWNDQAGRLSGNGLQGVFVTDLSFTASTCR